MNASRVPAHWFPVKMHVSLISLFAVEPQPGKQALTEAVVHLYDEKAAPRTVEAPHERLRRERGRGKVLVRVDEVVVRRVVQHDAAEPDGEAREARPDPRDRRVRRPRKDEQPDGDAPARDHHRDEPRLGRRVPPVLLVEVEVVPVHERPRQRTHDDAHGDGDEHEARDTVREALAFLEDDRIAVKSDVSGAIPAVNWWCDVREEEHVKQAVDDAHVEGNQHDNQLLAQQLERPEQRDLHHLAQRPRMQLLLGQISRVVLLLAESGRSVAQYGRCKRLGNGKDHENVAYTAKNEHNPVYPPPADRLAHEPANDGAWWPVSKRSLWLKFNLTDSRPEKRSGAECSHRRPSLFILPHVCQRPSHKGHRRAESDTVDRSTHQERTDVFCHSARNNKNNRNAKRDDVHDLPPEQLAHGSEHHRPDAESHDEQRHRQDSHLG